MGFASTSCTKNFSYAPCTNNPFLCSYRRRSLFRRAYKNDVKTTENSQLEMVDRHVYANPSYAGHFEIGGMPFYLPHNDAKMSEEGKLSYVKLSIFKVSF